MTAPTPDTGAAINAQAAAWIERRDRDGWSEADQAALEAWLAKSAAHRAAFWRLELVWKDTDRLAAFRAPPRPTNPSSPVPGMVRLLAALVVIAVTGGAAYTYLGTAPEKVYSTTVGGRQILTLSDGSKIDLNTDSAMRISMRPDMRKVWLDKGEAVFDVTHNADRPFIVMVGDRQVTDLGTKFQIRRDTDRLRVAVLEGRVQVDEKITGTIPVVLDAGDVAVAAHGSFTRERRATKELEKDLGWQQGVLMFDNRTLGDVTQEFNRYNTRKIVIRDKAVAGTRIAGTFRSDNVNAFVTTLETVFGFRADRQGDQITISNAR